MAADGYNNTTHGGVGPYSNLQHNQVYKDNNAFGNKDVYGNKDVFGKKDVYGNKDVFGSKNQWKTDSAYGPEDEKPGEKYRRFSDLKILNENMMHMSNNTLPEDSRIEILSQGEKGEIKNILSGRIFKVSTVPALASLALGVVIVFTDSILISLFSFFVYFGILVRTFFYPAKLYYENIKYKTTKPAVAFFEEMDYWYKISVVNVYIYLTIVSIFMFVLSFYEEEVVEEGIKLLIKSPSTIGVSTMKSYMESFSFALGLKLLAFSNIIILIIYSKFANKEKRDAEIELKNRMRQIRNETLTRVQQIQADKNLTE